MLQHCRRGRLFLAVLLGGGGVRGLLALLLGRRPRGLNGQALQRPRRPNAKRLGVGRVAVSLSAGCCSCCGRGG